MTWNYLFDSPRRQRRDIEALREQVVLGSDDTQEKAKIERRLAQLEANQERLNLTLEAVLRLLEQRLRISPQDIALMVQRIDLADGVEDGMIGPDRSAEAPACYACGRPVNPKRDACIYCDAPLEWPTATEAPAAPERSITCAVCQTTVPERRSYFSDNGVVCETCFHG